MHDGGKLLRMLIDRLSIPRMAWLHEYCVLESKANLPSVKKARSLVLASDRWRLKQQLKLSEPCVIVGMGGLPCEVLTGGSLVTKRAGTCWDTMYGKVWITYAPDAALFDPKLVVDITGVLAAAARAAKIETKFNPKVPMFDWEPYEHNRVSGL